MNKEYLTEGGEVDIHRLYREALDQRDKWRDRAKSAREAIYDAYMSLDPHPPAQPNPDDSLEYLEEWLQQNGHWDRGSA